MVIKPVFVWASLFVASVMLSGCQCCWKKKPNCCNNTCCPGGGCNGGACNCGACNGGACNGGACGGACTPGASGVPCGGTNNIPNNGRPAGTGQTGATVPGGTTSYRQPNQLNNPRGYEGTPPVMGPQGMGPQGMNPMGMTPQGGNPWNAGQRTGTTPTSMTQSTPPARGAGGGLPVYDVSNEPVPGSRSPSMSPTRSSYRDVQPMGENPGAPTVTGDGE